MNTILLGFKTADGKGPATVIAGPEVPVSEKNQQIAAIKKFKTYPVGLVRVDHCKLLELEVGIAIKSQTEPEPEQPKKKSK